MLVFNKNVVSAKFQIRFDRKFPPDRGSQGGVTGVNMGSTGGGFRMFFFGTPKIDPKGSQVRFIFMFYVDLMPQIAL